SILIVNTKKQALILHYRNIGMICISKCLEGGPMNYDQAQNKIKKIISDMSGKYSRYNLFMDFINLTAITISNGVDKTQYEAREAKYMQIIKKYTKDEANQFAKMIAIMTLAYERQMGDFIGELYMTMEFSNKHSGQFFTPYDVSRMMANMLGVEPNENGMYLLNEPSSGSGGMIVAYAETLKLNNINYQEKMRVVCNDIDFDVVKMCYIQLSLLGIDAIVYQKNTLAPLDDPPGEVWYTPMNLINRANEQVKKENEQTEKMVEAMNNVIALEKPIEKIPETVPGQMDIFEF